MAKKIPDFKDEEEEKQFWKTHDVRDFINWKNAPSFVDRVFKRKDVTGEILKELDSKAK